MCRRRRRQTASARLRGRQLLDVDQLDIVGGEAAEAGGNAGLVVTGDGMTAGSQPLLRIDSSSSGKASLVGWRLSTGVELFALVTPPIEPQWLPEGGSPTPVFWEKKNHTRRSKGVVSAHSTSVLE